MTIRFRFILGLPFRRPGAYLPDMNNEAIWIETAIEAPPTLMMVEAEHKTGVVRVRYRGLDRWETLDGKQTDTPIRWRFIGYDPPSTGHFMRS